MKDIALIRDEHGEVEVDCSFAFAEPTIYKYLGMVEINNDRVHFFEYLG